MIGGDVAEFDADEKRSTADVARFYRLRAWAGRR